MVFTEKKANLLPEVHKMNHYILTRPEKILRSHLLAVRNHLLFPKYKNNDDI